MLAAGPGRSAYIAPERLFDEYMQQVQLPHVPPDYAANLHPAVARWHKDRGTNRITPEQARVALAAYYGLVTYMDERIGDILGALEASPFARNTIVVYLSDHGEMAGEHGMWWKDSFYEGSAGVPMIWSCPERFHVGRRESSIVNLVDVASTVIDFARAPELPSARGRSLRSLLDRSIESPADWHNVTFAETYTRGQRPARMIRSGPWKLNAYHGFDAPQLFNLESDPNEFNDLGRAPEYADIAAHLWDQVHAEWSGARVESRVARNQQRAQLIAAWRRETTLGVSERWAIPAGSNVFPER